MQNWTYQIIEELRDKTTWHSLNEFFTTHLSIAENDEARIRQLKEILDDLQHENIFIWKCGRWIENRDGKMDWIFDEAASGDQGSSYKNFLGYLDTGVLQTLENNKIEAKLTVKGLDYSYKIKREDELYKSAIGTNDSFKSANWKMPLLTLGLIIVSLIGLIKESLKDKQPQVSEPQLQKKVQLLDSIQQIHQKQIDALLKAKKDTSH